MAVDRAFTMAEDQLRRWLAEGKRPGERYVALGGDVAGLLRRSGSIGCPPSWSDVFHLLLAELRALEPDSRQLDLPLVA